MQAARTVTAKTVAAICAALLASPAVAQDDEEVPREYNVEVIVFVYEQDVSVGNEVFTPEPAPDVVDFSFAGDQSPTDPGELPESPREPESVSLDSSEPGTLPVEERESFQLPDFTLTPVDELGMTDVIDTLERLDVYNPILHAAWTQRALPKENSITMDLSMLTEPVPNLSGHFTLYLSRFLHLTVDLTLDNVEPVPIAVDVPNRSLFFGQQPPRTPGVIHYTIKDDRIFKNGDTRYFDHPRFGVIARVTRIEEPEESEEDEESGGAVVLDGVAGDQVVQ
ncbi:MAG: CsiV family protein [Woeseiaceae bacterium]|nr:CsiV family protein [Woeseiaceae bacterium]